MRLPTTVGNQLLIRPYRTFDQISSASVVVFIFQMFHNEGSSKDIYKLSEILRWEFLKQLVNQLSSNEEEREVE